MQKIIGIKFREGGKVYSFDPCSLDLSLSDKVVVDSAVGLSLGTVAFGVKEIDESAISEPLKRVVRKATEQDLKKYEELKRKAEKDIFFVRQKVRELGLEMKIVSAEYCLDASKIVIEFSAEERVDFRELLKQLAGALKVKIELHQVGQRDEVKIKGGLGPCGEVCCCARFLKDFEHVTVKMAKNQGLSLSPTKISGLCGRLMCCLAYENKAYEEILKRMPKVNSKVNSPKGEGIVVYNDLLRERVSVKVKGADENFTVYDFSLEELKESEGKTEEQQKQPRTFIENKPRNEEKEKVELNGLDQASQTNEKVVQDRVETHKNDQSKASQNSAKKFNKKNHFYHKKNKNNK